MEASIEVAASFFRSSRNVKTYKSACLRQWADNYLQTGELPEFKQGMHAKHSSIITDENVQEKFKTYLKVDDFKTTTILAS